MIDETLFDAEEKMEKAVARRQGRPGQRAHRPGQPEHVPRIVVDYYGAPTPLTQMASITVPEARMAVIKPYDASQLRRIEKAIRDSDLGVNPTNDGTIIRVVVPAADRGAPPRMVKVARAKGEDAKVSDPQHPPQGEGGAATSIVQGRRGRRGRGRAGPRRNCRPSPTGTSHQVDELVKHKEAELLEV